MLANRQGIGLCQFHLVAKEQQTEWRVRLVLGGRGRLLLLSPMDFHHCVSYENSVFQSCPPSLVCVAFRLPQHASGSIPYKMRGPSIFNDSMRVSEAICSVFFSSSESTASHCLCYCFYLPFCPDTLCFPTARHVTWSRCQFGNSCYAWMELVRA